MKGVGSNGKVAIVESPQLKVLQRERLVDGEGALDWDAAARSLCVMEGEEPE